MLALHPEAAKPHRGQTRYRLLDMLRPQPYYLVRNFDEMSGSGTLDQPSHASAENRIQFSGCRHGRGLPPDCRIRGRRIGF